MRTVTCLSGFTLTELLIVIAILMLLAALLFPAFATARENSRRSACQSNLKQIGLAVMQYTQDFDGRYPSVYRVAGTNVDVWKLTQPYLQSELVWRCPSDTPPDCVPTDGCPSHFFCRACRRAYTPQPKVHGYDSFVRQEAVRYSLEGLSQRKVARLLRVSPQSVANWLAQAGDKLQESGIPLVPPELAALCGEIMEQDELYTFCTAKAAGKNPVPKTDSAPDSVSHAQKKSDVRKTTNQDGST